MKKTKLVPDPENINLVTINDWGLPKSDAIMDLIKEAVRSAAAEAIAYSLAEEVWFNFDPDRPLIGRVSLPLTNSENDNGPAWEIDLRREFMYFLDYHKKDEIQEMRDELVIIIEKFNEALGVAGGIEK